MEKTANALPRTPKPLRSEIRGLIRLGFPIVISLAAATLIGVIDTIMIAPLGTVPLAAASITNSIIILFYSGLYGFVSAVGVRMAGAVGADDPSALSKATWTGLLLGLGIGALGTLVFVSLRPALSLLGQPSEVLDELPGVLDRDGLSIDSVYRILCSQKPV